MKLNKQQKSRIQQAKDSGLTYERLFILAYEMHLEIFKLAGKANVDEKEIYDRLGLTDDENELFGYGYLNNNIKDPKIAEMLKAIIRQNMEKEND